MILQPRSFATMIAFHQSRGCDQTFVARIEIDLGVGRGRAAVVRGSRS